VSQLPSSLRRELRLFHAYRFLSTSYLFLAVLDRFFQARGLDFTRITLLNTVYAATLIVCEVPTGALADLFGRCRAMMLGSLLMALGCLVDYQGHDFWTFAVGEGLLALGMTLTSGADSAWLYDLLRQHGREDEYRRYEGSATAAKLVGAAAALVAGGWLGERAPALTYAVTAGVCLVAALIAMMMREPRICRVEEPRFFRGMAHAGRAVVTSRPLLFAVGFSVLVFTLLRMGLYLHPAYLRQAHLSTTQVGIALAVLSVVGALAAQRIEAVRRLFGESRLVWLLPLALAASYAAMGRFFASWGIALLAVQSLVNGVFSPFSKELINREIPDSGLRATVLSFESMARRIAFGAFAPVCGVLIDGRGLSAGLMVCGIAGGVGGLVLLASAVRRHRRGLHGFEGEVTPTPVPAAVDDKSAAAATNGYSQARS
jgi:predicted MFS family arabinose efflux permease